MVLNISFFHIETDSYNLIAFRDDKSRRQIMTAGGAKETKNRQTPQLFNLNNSEGQFVFYREGDN
jgi:hypothetical protein